MRKTFSVKCWAIVNGIALLILSIAFIVVLFIENQWGHSATCYLIYSACWFKVFVGLLMCAVIANLFVFRLLRRSIVSVGLFHMALLLIFLGFFFINLKGQKGGMHLEKGHSTDCFLSDRPFFKAELTDNENQDVVEKEVFLTSLGANQLNFHIGKGPCRASIRSGEIIDKAIPSIVPDSKGTAMLELVVGTAEGMKTIILHPNSRGQFFDPDHSTEMPPIAIIPLNGSIYLSAEDTLHSLNLSTQQHDRIVPGKFVLADARLLYSSGKIPFLFGRYLEHASVDYIIGNNANAGQPVMVVEVASAGEKKIIPVSEKGVQVLLGRSKINLKFGYKKYSLPFTFCVKEALTDRATGLFRGDNVCLTDRNSGRSEDYFISGGHSLNVRGYCFSLVDSKGTFSVTRHCFGETLCYGGFFLILLSLLWFILDPASYGRKLIKQSRRINPLLSILLLWCVTSSFSYANDLPSVNPKVAASFGHLWVKSGGRIGTVNTLDRELLKRVNGHSHFKRMNADEVILSMMLNPLQWQNERVLKTHRDLAAAMGFSSSLITYNSLFDAKGKYLLDEDVREARSKAYETQTPYERVIVALDDEVSTMNGIFRGTPFCIFPDRKNGAWLNPADLLSNENSLRHQDIGTVLGRFLRSVNEGKDLDALNALQNIADFQREEGTVPSNLKRYAELIYNKIVGLNVLLSGYLIGGLCLLLMGFVRRTNHSGRIAGKIVYSLAIMALLFHLSIILLRGYITESCPWVGGPEWLFFLSCGVVLLGCLVGKDNYFTMGSSCFLAGIILLVMSSSGMDLSLTISGGGELLTWQNSYSLLVALGIGAVLLCIFQNLCGIVLTAFKLHHDSQYEFLQRSGVLSFGCGLCLLIVGLLTGIVGTGVSMGYSDLCDVREIGLLVLITMLVLVALSLHFSQVYGVWWNIAILAILPTVVMNTIVFYSYSLWNGYRLETNTMKGIVFGSVLVGLIVIVLTGIVNRRKEIGNPAKRIKEM